MDATKSSPSNPTPGLHPCEGCGAGVGLDGEDFVAFYLTTDDAGRSQVLCPGCFVASIDAPMQHVYVSTYCQHGQHEDCRLECKVCAAPCRCGCHGPHP